MANDPKDIDIEAAEITRNIQYFCGSVLLYYQNVLSDKELYICKRLINGQTLQGVASSLALTRERVRQHFHKAIYRIRHAHQVKLDEMAELKEENERLKHRIQLLEKEYLSEKSLEYVNSIMGQEEKLCRNAKRLLTTPISELPLPPRLKNALERTKASTFGELPSLTVATLLSTRQCGKKAIYDLQAYLQKYSLDLGMTYDDVVIQLAKLNDEDIPLHQDKVSAREAIKKELEAFLAQENDNDINKTKI